MANESRLSITIDSRSAEQQAKDLAVVLEAATKAGVNVSVAAEKAGKATAGAGAQFSKAGKDANSGASGVGKLGKSMDDARSTAVSLRAALTGAFVGVSIASTISKIIAETSKAEQEQAQLGAVLKSTGEAAGFNAVQLNDMAGSMSLVSTVSSGEINKAQTTLLAFTGIVGDQFTEALQAGIDMAARTGMSVVQATETIGRALDVPSQGLTALSRQGFRFTEDQKKLAKQLEDTGRTAEAQGIILGALKESYGGAAAAARDTFGGSITGLRNQLDDLMNGGDGSLDEAKNGVNELTRTLASDETKQAFSSFVSLVTGATNSLVTFAAASRNGWPGMIASLEAGAVKSGDFAGEMQRLRKEIDEMEMAAAKSDGVNRWIFDKGIQYRKGRLEALGKQMNNELGGMFPTDVPTLSPISVSPAGGGGGRGGGGKKPKAKEVRNYLADGLDEFLIRIGEAPEAIDGMGISFEKTTDKMGEFAIQSARSIQQSMGDGLYDILSGNFDGIGAKFGQTIMKMAADAAAANLAGALFGNYDKNGQIGGMVGNIIGSIWPGPAQGNLTGSSLSGATWGTSYKFSDGGYTGPGGKYEVAGLVHRDEGVLNKEDMAALGGERGFNQLRSVLRRGYSSGGIGGQAPGAFSASGGAPGGVTVNIIGGPQEKPEVRTSRDQNGGLSIDLIYKQLEDRMAGGVASGQGKMGKAIQNRFGLVPQLG